MALERYFYPHPTIYKKSILTMKVQFTESDIQGMVLEGVKGVMKLLSEKVTVDPATGEWFDDGQPDEEGAHDEWASAVDKHEMGENLPRGWERFDREDDEPIYQDPDGNEYVKDEYGKFKPIESEPMEDEYMDDDDPAGVPSGLEEALLKKRIKGMIRESLEEMGFNNMMFNRDMAERHGPTSKSKHSQANQHYKTNPKTNRQARATKRAIVLKWLRDPKQAVNCAEIMRQLWNPSPQDEDTKRGEFYKKRDGAINKQSGARYSFTDEEINQLYRIKSNRS